MARTEILTTRQQQPGLIARLALAVLRSSWSGPLTAKSPELARLWGGGATSSGIAVNEASAMASSAVWSAVTQVADDIASLPLHLYKRLPNGGKDRFETHPLYRLLHDAPNPEMTSMVWRRTMQAHAMIWQNAYAEIERDAIGRPVAIWPLVPERVAMFRSGGAVKYRVSNVGTSDAIVDAADMIHLVGHSHDGSLGCSIIDHARESLALGLAAEKFGAAMYGNGLTIGGTISYAGPKPPEMSDDNYLKSLSARHQGVERAHKLLALYNGAKYERMNIQPNDAQFLETRVFQIREVARWFKIPPHKLGDLADATYSNVEQMDSAYLGTCLRPWLVLWQQELAKKLIAPSERNLQFIEHLTQGLLMVDAASRAALHTADFNVGSVTPNEIRGHENRDPIAGGDQAFVQMNMMPLGRIDEWVDAQIASLKAKDRAPEPAPPTDEQLNSVKETVERSIAAQNAAIAAESDKRAKAEADAAVAAEQITGLVADLEQATRAVDAATVELAAMDARRQQEIDSVSATAAERIRGIEADMVSVRLQRDEALTVKGETELMLSVAERSRDEAAAREVAARSEMETLTAALSTAKAERDAFAAQIPVIEAAAAELRTMVDRQAQDAKAAQRAHLETESARVLAEAKALEREAALLLAEEQKKADARAVAEAQARVQAARIAHRALIVDTVERLLQRESDRARKAQATPEKLRAWVDTFYPVHAETVRKELRPIVVAMAACSGGDVDATVDSLVRSHIGTSTTYMRDAADTTDAEELATNVARVLHRWETERAATFADAWLAEGERHGH